MDGQQKNTDSGIQESKTHVRKRVSSESGSSDSSRSSSLTSIAGSERQRGRRAKKSKMLKTPVTVLQELMVKFVETPEYECVAQSGPQHQALFEYRCSARGHVVSASARSKKEAKQEAARLMLHRLAAAGLPVPAPHAGPAPAAAPPSQPGAAAAAAAGSRSYKALLKELCEEYHLPAPEYSLEGDTGPAHARRFTARCAVGAHARLADASTKKAAQQSAAHQVYRYLRENLASVTKDFVEEDALARAHERAMERYVAARADAPWRPDMTQRVADYHLGLLQHLEEEQAARGAAALAAGGAGAEAALAAAAAALGLTPAWHALPAAGGPLALLRLAPSSPPLVFAAPDARAAAAEALAYLQLSMRFEAENLAADSSEMKKFKRPENSQSPV